jgi:hypothetical protein
LFRSIPFRRRLVVLVATATVFGSVSAAQADPQPQLTDPAASSSQVDNTTWTDQTDGSTSTDDPADTVDQLGRSSWT